MDFPSILSSSYDLAPSHNFQHYEDMIIDSSGSSNHASITIEPSKPRPYRAITHLAFVTAFIVPITFLPYLLARRQLTSLRKQLIEANASMRVLQQELGGALREIGAQKDDQKRIRTLVGEITRKTEAQRLRSEEKENERLKQDAAVKSDLKTLLDEMQHSRNHAATLRALGTSLADVAAFMHEIELEMGMLSSYDRDQRGIDRLRLLAFRMEGIGRQHKPLENPELPSRAMNVEQ